ncbi:MAG: CD0415/CD1112 family protein [Angelakisella sp.]
MNSLLQGINDWIKNILIDMIMRNLSDMMALVNAQGVRLGTEVAMSPSVWNSSIWTMVQSVATTVIVPIAGLVLVGAMTLEIIGWLNESNHMHSTGDVMAQLFKLLLKIGLGAILVSKAMDITMFIFDLSAYVIAKSMGIVTTNAAQLSVGLSGMRAIMMTSGVGELLGLAFTSLIGKIGMMVIGIAIRLVLAGRMIEIYIYCACGSAPYATLTNKSLSGIGQNYIKNLLALAFQGFFMLLMVGIYVALMQSTINSITAANVEGMITEVLLISITLVMMILRSKSIAKSIFSAH